MEKENDYNPIFIVGCARSGTTLLRSILSSHPNISIPRETSFFQYLDDFLDKNKIENLNKEDVLNFWTIYSSTRRFTYQGLKKEKIEDILNKKDQITFKYILDTLMRVYLESVNKNRWGEKTPGHEYHLQRILNWYPDAKIIFLIRDPRAVASSFKNVPWGSNFIRIPIKLWNRSIDCWEKYYSDSRVMTVKYEDLVSNVIESTKSICEFIKEDFTDDMIANRMSFIPSKVENSWTNEYEKQVSQEVTNDSINKWEKTLSKFEISIIEILNYRAFNKLGYKKQFETNKIYFLPKYWGMTIFKIIVSRVKNKF